MTCRIQPENTFVVVDVEETVVRNAAFDDLLLLEFGPTYGVGTVVIVGAIIVCDCCSWVQ